MNEVRLIDANELERSINTYDKFACLPNGKLEPFRNLEHPEMFEPYVHLRDIRNAIENAPTIEPRIEYGSDGEPYRLFISGGQVVPDTLQGWRYEERPTGEWIVVSREDCNTFLNPIYKCPFCGEVYAVKKPYCTCGAKMIEEAENE